MQQVEPGATSDAFRRAAARDRRDFTTADAIRSSLTALGVEISDTPTGTRWSLHADLSAKEVG